MTSPERFEKALESIETELDGRIAHFKSLIPIRIQFDFDVE